MGTMSDHGLTATSTPSDHGVDLSELGGGNFDSSGFDGNLAVTDDTVQKVFDKLDNLVSSGSTGIIATPNDGELHLTPKSISTGAEGTMFYNSDDNSVYVGVE
jgi:hypothetical protein